VNMAVFLELQLRDKAEAIDVNPEFIMSIEDVSERKMFAPEVPNGAIVKMSNGDIHLTVLTRLELRDKLYWLNLGER